MIASGKQKKEVKVRSMCLMRNLQVRFPKIILVLFDIPVNGLTEGGDAMWGYNQDNCFTEGCGSSYE